VALIDTNNILIVDDRSFNMDNYSISILEDPKVAEIMEYYKRNLIFLEEAVRMKNCFPFTVIAEKIKEEDEPILSRWEILDL